MSNCSKQHRYSITSSATVSSVGGTVRPEHARRLVIDFGYANRHVIRPHPHGLT